MFSKVAIGLSALVSTPCVGHSPTVVFSPATPQRAAGTRTEPPVSVPSVKPARPAAVATPEPDDEPGPGRRSSHSDTALYILYGEPLMK